MLLFALLACAPGELSTEDGPDTLRAALFFAPDASLSVAARGTRQVYVLLANSTVPCEPDDVEDDPTTEADETNVAREYWMAQLYTAFSREGARVVLATLITGAEVDWLGRYDADADAWDPTSAAERVAEHDRVAAAAWFHVEEAAVDDINGVLYASEIEIVESEHERAVDGGGFDIVAKDSVLEGAFDFPEADLSGRFTADRCDNAELLTALYHALWTLSAELEP